MNPSVPDLPLARSVLYVPASRPRMLAKLVDLPAELFLLDLEDGVAPEEKEPAREHLREAWEQGQTPPGRWGVRINAAGSAWHAADLELASRLRPPLLVLPKAETPSEVAEVGRRSEVWGGSVGLMIETARGVGQVRSLASAHPGVVLLLFGSADYRLSIGARPDPARSWEMHALQEILLAARMAGCLANDGVFFRFRDVEGLQRHARIARDLGYDGKSCIHPSQIEPIHDVFSSTGDELDWAWKVTRAWREQDGDRRGVVVLDGEMIEALHVLLARRILARAPRERP